MRLVLLTMGAYIGVFLFACSIEVALGVHVPYVSEVMAALTGNSVLGTARNVISDGPMRRATLPPGVTPIGETNHAI